MERNLEAFKVALAHEMSTLSECCFLSYYNMKCVLFCSTGDGERMEWIRSAGERCGLAEVCPAGTDEPQWSFSGLWLSDLSQQTQAATNSHVWVCVGMSYRLLNSCVQAKQRLQCGWYLFRGSCVSFKLKAIIWQYTRCVIIKQATVKGSFCCCSITNVSINFCFPD